MNPSQHINSITKRLGPSLKKKYAAGVRAHGGKLWEKNVGPEITDELLDLIVYVYTREEQVTRLVNAAKWVVYSDVQGRNPSKAEIHTLFDALAPFLNKPTKGND
jgi:hypothetical protein